MSRPEKGGTVFQEFRKFVLRGNVVDLAVGVVIGAAFAAVVASFTAAFITPLIALLGGSGDFSGRAIHIGPIVNPKTHVVTGFKAIFKYGAFIQSTISFLITAVVVFFFVVKPINALTQRMRKEPSPDPTTKKCPECLSEIPIDARRCAYCTSEQKAAA